MIALEVHLIDERRSYVAKFATDAQAISFIKAREPHGPRRAEKYLLGQPVGGHVFYVADPDNTEGWDAAPQTTAYLFPECKHGLSQANCYGPQHYYFDEEEQARGLHNGW